MSAGAGQGVAGPCLDGRDGAVLLRVRVKPRSAREGIEGLSEQGELVVRLAAAPVDNQANQALTSLIARKLRLPKSAVTVASGPKSRQKTLKITGTDRPRIEALWKDLK